MSDPWKDAEVLDRMYWGWGLSTTELGEFFGVHNTTILKYMKRNDVPRRKPGGERTVQMKVTTGTGKGHEYVQHANGDGSTSKVRIHRLAAVAWFGFEETAGMVVHHKDPEGKKRPGVPWDNRESNIELMTESDHNRHHAMQQPWMVGKYTDRTWDDVEGSQP